MGAEGQHDIGEDQHQQSPLQQFAVAHAVRELAERVGRNAVDQFIATITSGMVNSGISICWARSTRKASLKRARVKMLPMATTHQ